jgi:hypothetical protein
MQLQECLRWGEGGCVQVLGYCCRTVVHVLYTYMNVICTTVRAGKSGGASLSQLTIQAMFPKWCVFGISSNVVRNTA